MTATATPQLTPIKQALLKIDALRRELSDVRQAIAEPIAVVGIGCRLPGGADSAEQLWDMLAAGTDAVTEVPPDRWTDALYDPRPGRTDTSYCRHGAFIDGVDRFDPAFFGISGREARRIDPQQRLLLECTWRAMEDARFTREALKAHKAGVFVGSSLDDYARISEVATGAELSYAQTSLGTARPFAAGRISYLFGFHGPTVQLDTACSSSLTTTHLACQSLRQRECDVAFTAGVNLMLSPEMTIALCELQALSPDGRCKTFDAGANGYVRGEGCGVLALMRLSDARAQKRPIRALIRGSAINHDGRSNGMTAPNGRAQRDVIRDALARAGVAPDEVDYVEAHGTGTLLGDPIELRALHEVYCSGTGRRQDLHVGSIKTNIGHLEGAASVSALIKVVCALQKGEIPRHLHCETPTPHVDWHSNGIRVVDRHMPWPSSRPGKRVAAVSSFGMSGTNAHLIVESYPDDDAAATGMASPHDVAALGDTPAEPQLFALSAHSDASLRRVLADCAEQLRRTPRIVLADLAHSLRVGRDTHRHRTAVVASSAEQLLEGLAGAERALGATRHGEASGQLAFLFTGQGAQYGGMARRLYQSFPVFRDTIDACDRCFDTLGEYALVDVLWGDQQELIHDTRYTQPAMFAVELALARLWTRWGVVPDVVMGHSVGEYAAACLAGVFSLEDAFRLVAARGQLMHALTPAGKMSAVFASAAELAPYLAAYRGRVELAGDNAPGSVVVSGEPEAVDALTRELERDGLRAKPLTVSRAFHSPLMEPMLAAFREVADSVSYRAPSIRLVSNVSGAVESDRLCDPAYWVEHVRGAVLFRQGMDTLVRDGVTRFLELGPGRVLSTLAKACCAQAPEADSMRWLHSFDAQRDEREQLLSALGNVYAGGRPVDWAAFEASLDRPVPPRRIALPPYPLDMASYWVGERAPAERGRPFSSALAAPARTGDGLLGRELHLPALQERRFEGRLAVSDFPFLRGHVVHGRLVFPAAGFIAVALDAAARVSTGDAIELRELAFDAALTLDEAQAAVLGTVVHTTDGRIDIYSTQQDAAWTRHCSARVAAAAAVEPDHTLATFQALCSEALAADAMYERLQAAGLAYDGAFRSVREIVRGPQRALGRIELDAVPTAAASRSIDPALLDNCFQVVAAALWDAAEARVFLPIGIERLRCRPIGQATTLWCAVELKGRTPLVSADLRLFDAAGACVAELTNLQLAAVDAARLAGADASSTLYALRWKPLTGEARSMLAVEPGDYLLIGGGAAIDAGIEAALGAAGVPNWVVPARAPWLAPPSSPPDTDAACVDRFRTVLAEFAERSTSARQQVLVYVWPHETSDDDEPQAVVCAYRRFANFWRAVQATDWTGRSVAVSVVTQQGERVPGLDHAVVPAQAAARGLARSLMHESADMRVLAIDLPADAAPSAATALQAIGLGLRSDESEFAVRGNAVQVPRMVRRAAPASQAPALMAGTQLVTGGRGAIGTQLVEWLIARGASKVVSVSRQLPANGECHRLSALAVARGVALEFVAADLSDPRSVTQLVATLDADRDRPLKGIFHAAGTLEDGLLLTQPFEAVERVLAPKVAGTLHLHRATAHLALDHFVSFSSVVASIGSPGQCAYAAANAYTDALSLQRNEDGLAAHTINWGLWGGRGMAEQLDAQQMQRIEAFGLHALEPEAALQTLDGLLGERMGQSLVWRVDVPTLLGRSASPALRPLLGELAAAVPVARRAARTSTGFGQRLRALPPEQRTAALSRHLVDELAQTLLVGADRVDPRRPLIELGLDSLMAAEFRSGIRTELDVDIPFGRLLEGATLDDVVRLLVERIADDKRGPVGTPEPRREQLRLDTVSTEASFGAEMESGQL